MGKPPATAAPEATEARDKALTHLPALLQCALFLVLTEMQDFKETPQNRKTVKSKIAFYHTLSKKLLHSGSL